MDNSDARYDELERDLERKASVPSLPGNMIEPHKTLHHDLPIGAAARKALPVYSGFVKYFPKAMVAVCELSKKGNDQHNPGKPLHWDRSKSGDEKDALMRHLLEAGAIDTDGIRHSAKVAWRAMANLEKELEEDLLLSR